VLTNYKTHTEKELLQLIAKDDSLAFGEIYDRFWKPLFAIAYNRLQDIQVAEDVVQDVFTSLWKNRISTEVASLKNYLAVATKYVVFAKIKKIIIEREYLSSALQVPLFEQDTDSLIDNKRLLEFIQKEVATLPEKCRLIFNYRDKGMSTKEIAKELNVTPKTVENQINKAFRHLRNAVSSLLHSFLCF